MSGAASRYSGTRLEFARIDEATRKTLRDLWTVVEPNLDGILAGFYKHLVMEPSLRELLGNRQAALESAQKTHWQRLFSAKFDEDYESSINRIGRAHSRIGLEPRWYIAGYQFVLNELTAVVLKRHRFSVTKAQGALQALNKAVLLDLDYAISTYQQILMEEQEARTRCLSEAIDRFKDKVEASLATVDKAADTMQKRADTLSSVAGAASHEAISASAASEQTSTSVQTVASAAEELASSIEEIARQVTGASDVARRANVVTDSASREVGLLSVTAQKIGDVIGLIQAIAEQTNLLALNATIEAARAGDAGRGFAIVAQEVKNLAGQTSRATEDIAQQIAEIQSATTRAVDTISSIASTVGEIDTLTATIAAAIEEQGAATREISMNVQHAAQGTVTLTRNVTGVTAAIDKTEDAARDFLVVSGDLRGQSDQISGQIRDFFSEIRQTTESGAAKGKHTAASGAGSGRAADTRRYA
ncbi:globin-coupled sensor protein [Stappia sp. 28M-7]|uniref:globin-coupled sensor protein n=1 Tax=Stappia sp. 28M-7 TaxID=2762596 RepID=UPI000E75599D|nr:globin-coupled sensor protein [Stappia sp. 28M-7]MBC2858765.1 globin-coupled sensor protein [Stappia sp. 28M-7]